MCPWRITDVLQSAFHKPKKSKTHFQFQWKQNAIASMLCVWLWIYRARAFPAYVLLNIIRLFGFVGITKECDTLIYVKEQRNRQENKFQSENTIKPLENRFFVYLSSNWIRKSNKKSPLCACVQLYTFTRLYGKTFNSLFSDNNSRKLKPKWNFK